MQKDADWPRRCPPGTAACFHHLAERSYNRRECSVPGGLAVSRPQATRLAFTGLVALGSVVETNLTVLFVWARGLPAAAPLVAWRATPSLLVLGQEMPAAAAGNGAYGSLILQVDGAMVQLALLQCNRLAYSAISLQSLKSLAIRWSRISESRRRTGLSSATSGCLVSCLLPPGTLTIRKLWSSRPWPGAFRC